MTIQDYNAPAITNGGKGYNTSISKGFFYTRHTKSNRNVCRINPRKDEVVTYPNSEGAYPKVKSPSHKMTIDMGPTTVEVDEKLVPLLKSLWELGFKTSSSSEGTKDMNAYVEFEESKDLKRFTAALEMASLKFEVSYQCKNHETNLITTCRWNSFEWLIGALQSFRGCARRVSLPQSSISAVTKLYASILSTNSKV